MARELQQLIHVRRQLGARGEEERRRGGGEEQGEAGGDGAGAGGAGGLGGQVAALRRDFEKPLFYFCSQERKAGEFHSRCLLQCYCQESHLQEVRQVARQHRVDRLAGGEEQAGLLLPSPAAAEGEVTKASCFMTNSSL